MPTLAVLMTVYHGTRADELSVALDSLRTQTRPADQLVIVEDGPVDPAVHELAQAADELVVLPENKGSGPASQAGLEAVNADFFARLDSDDAAAPERFERQLAYFAAHPQIDVLGTAMAEFTHAPGDGQAVRRLPTTTHALRRYVAINSPVNNPSVMMRTDVVRAVGGYRDVHHMEDYDLYARLVANGARLANLDEPLTYFRVTPAQFGRRTGREMFAAERQMQRNLVDYGLISQPRAVANLLARTAYRSLPTGLLTRVYSALFHRNAL